MADVVERLMVALEPDHVVLGGGNVKKLKELPSGCRTGDNANGFRGGNLLWKQRTSRKHCLPGDREKKKQAKPRPG